MHAKKPVTVVNIISPSYTGTTWLGLLLGSHPRAFALGAPDRIWKLARSGGDDEACRAHGHACPFWPGFLASYDRGANLYLQLAEACERDVVIINNPSVDHEQDELRHPDLVVRTLRIVRDGRALACSYARHHDVDFYDAVVKYVGGVYDGFPFDADDDDPLSMRYEDLVADQPGHLERIGEALGMTYEAAAMRFWEFDHHVTAGNAGAIAILKAFQGLDVKEFRNRPFYGEQFEQMKREGGAFLDERWKDEVGPRERFVFDHFCGRRNAAWGYGEDAFTASQRDEFEREMGEELRPVRSGLTRRVRAGAARARGHGSRLLTELAWTRSRKRLLVTGLVVALVLWIASLVASWLIAMWVTGR